MMWFSFVAQTKLQTGPCGLFVIFLVNFEQFYISIKIFFTIHATAERIMCSVHVTELFLMMLLWCKRAKERETSRWEKSLKVK